MCIYTCYNSICKIRKVLQVITNLCFFLARQSKILKFSMIKRMKKIDDKENYYVKID